MAIANDLDTQAKCKMANKQKEVVAPTSVRDYGYGETGSNYSSES